MECSKALIVMLILNSILLVISLSTLACNSKQMKNFKNYQNWKPKDVKGLLDVATLYLINSGTDIKFINNFKNYEIGLTVSIFLCLMTVFSFSILISCYKVDSEKSENIHKDLVYLCNLLIISLFLLFIGKIIIHSYVVYIYTRYSIKI